MELCIGLFGTCGRSTWRNPFMAEYQQRGIRFFNPQVENWNPSDAEREARHLAEDLIVLFPVTSETYAVGSLAETGFSILQAISLDDRRDLVVMIDRDLDPDLTDEPSRRDSLRARALVREHLIKLRLPNIYFVDDLEEMLRVSLVLYEAALLREPLRKFNPHNRPRPPLV